MVTIKLSNSEVETIGRFFDSNPCSIGCAYPEMQNSKINCDECKLTKDMYSIVEKLGLSEFY